MNVFDLVAASAKTYRSKLGSFLVAGITLMLASGVVFGWLSAILIVDGMIALTAGPVYGAWAKSPGHIWMMGAVSIAGIGIVSLLAFSLWGGFLNLCAKIGNKSSEAGLVEFVGYGLSRWRTFFSIGALQLLCGSLFSIPGIAVAFLNLPAGLILMLLGHTASAAVFFFAYPAAVEDGCGASSAVSRSLKAFAYKPVAGITTYVLCALVFAAGTPLLPLYPIYYFVVASPIIATVQLSYYQRVKTA